MTLDYRLNASLKNKGRHRCSEIHFSVDECIKTERNQYGKRGDQPETFPSTPLLVILLFLFTIREHIFMGIIVYCTVLQFDYCVFALHHFVLLIFIRKPEQTPETSTISRRNVFVEYRFSTRPTTTPTRARLSTYILYFSIRHDGTIRFETKPVLRLIPRSTYNTDHPSSILNTPNFHYILDSE